MNNKKVDILELINQESKTKFLNHLDDSRYHYRFFSWVKDFYFQTEDDLDTKQAKLLCLSLFMNEKSVFLSPKSNFIELVNGVFTEIKDSGNPSFNKRALFPTKDQSDRDIFRSLSSSVNPNEENIITQENLIKNYLEKQERVALFQEAYKPFSRTAMLGNAIINDRPNFEAILIGQNYKLNIEDINLLQHYSDTFNKKIDMKHLYPALSSPKELLPLINNENDISYLAVLKSYYKGQELSKHAEFLKEQREEIYQLIDKKIHYLKLNSEVTDIVKDQTQSKKPKL